MQLQCHNCPRMAKPCAQASKDLAWLSQCLRIQGWTKSSNRGVGWRCQVCTYLNCKIPYPPEEPPWCWYEGHAVNPEWEALFRGADEQKEVQQLPGLQSSHPPPLPPSAGATHPPPPPPFSPAPPPPPPPLSQQMPGLRPPPLPPLPENAGAELFTIEFLNAVALHRKMIRDWGDPYLEELDKHMTKAGLVDVSSWDTMPSAPSSTSVAVGASSMGSSSSNAVWSAHSVQYTQNVQTHAVANTTYGYPWKQNSHDRWNQKPAGKPAVDAWFNDKPLSP